LLSNEKGENRDATKEKFSLIPISCSVHDFKSANKMQIIVKKIYSQKEIKIYTYFSLIFVL